MSQRALDSAIVQKTVQDAGRLDRAIARDAARQGHSKAYRRSTVGKAALASLKDEARADAEQEALELVALGRCMRALDRPFDAMSKFEAALRVVPYHAPALAERAKSGVMFAFRRALAVCAESEDAEAKASAARDCNLPVVVFGFVWSSLVSSRLLGAVFLHFFSHPTAPLQLNAQ